MKPAKLLPPILAYSTGSLYLIGGFVESIDTLFPYTTLFRSRKSVV